jgi:hypothetical protein
MASASSDADELWFDFLGVNLKVRKVFPRRFFECRDMAGIVVCISGPKAWIRGHERHEPTQ